MGHTNFVKTYDNRGNLGRLRLQGGGGIYDACFSKLFLKAFPSSQRKTLQLPELRQML